MFFGHTFQLILPIYNGTSRVHFYHTTWASRAQLTFNISPLWLGRSLPLASTSTAFFIESVKSTFSKIMSIISESVVSTCWLSLPWPVHSLWPSWINCSSCYLILNSPGEYTGAWSITLINGPVKSTHITYPFLMVQLTLRSSFGICMVIPYCKARSAQLRKIPCSCWMEG